MSHLVRKPMRMHLTEPNFFNTLGEEVPFQNFISQHKRRSLLCKLSKKKIFQYLVNIYIICITCIKLIESIIYMYRFSCTSSPLYFDNLSVSLSVCLSVGLSVCLSVCLRVNMVHIFTCISTITVSPIILKRAPMPGFARIIV